MNNYNTDGFNERNNYIRNANDINRLNQNGPSNFDNSFAQMRVNENKPDIKTAEVNHETVIEETRGNRENFVVRNANMRNFNVKPSINNPVSNALNRNMFKR